MKIGDMGGGIRKTSQKSSKPGTTGQPREAREAMEDTQTTRILQAMEKGLGEREVGRGTACHLKKRAYLWRLPPRLLRMKS